METLNELEAYLKHGCYDKVIIGKRPIEDCLILWQEAGGYCFGYCERGRISTLRTFETERDLVAYALGELERNIWLKAHLAAWTWTEPEILAAQRELTEMGISFQRNDIPNFDREHGRAYRLFVFGRDILRLSAFQKRYRRE